MALIVRKYGGSSVATIDKIKFVALQIKELVNAGNQVVLVVSAMGDTTDELLNQAREISQNPNLRELDMLLSIGERKSISLMALALNALDIPCKSFTGSQVGIITNNEHGNATILEIKAERIVQTLAEGKVVVVAGFQGVSLEKEITTLGRGGTDTTAVAVAAAINADRCELMKDVDGVFNVSPKWINSAYLRKEISYAEIFAMAEAGAEVIAKPAIELATFTNVKLGIGNTFTSKIGTIVTKKPLDLNGLQQIIISPCFFSLHAFNTKTPYQRIIHLQKAHLYLDLDPDAILKDAILITLLGKGLDQMTWDYINRIECEYKHLSNTKIELLLKKDIFDLYENEIKLELSNHSKK
jgi:aspartate kinase